MKPTRRYLYSEPGHGTMFKIYLPRGERSAELADVVAQEPIRRGSETILLVEDDARVRRLVGELLAGAGYNVLTSDNAGEAISTSEAYDSTIHLVITDVIMPGLSGPELAKRLTELRPDVKVLYTSGYTNGVIVHHGILDEGVSFLEKPFTPDKLLRRVREVLDMANKES